MSAPSALPKADAKFSADTAAQPVEATLRPPGTRDFRHDMAWEWPPSAAGDCRCPPTGAKGDRTPNMVSCPLLTPLTFLCADTSEMCSETGVRGLGSGRRTDFRMLLCPEFTLRDLPRITVRGHPVQGANAVAAKSSASIKGCALEHQTHLWAPRFLTRDRRESRPKERSGRQEGQGNLGVPAPFAPAAGRRHSRPPKAAIAHALRGRKVASSGAPLYRRKVHRQQTVNKRHGRPNGGKSPPLPRRKSFLFSLLTGLCYCIIIIVQHNKKGLRLCSGSFVGIARSTSRSWKS